MMVVTVLSRLVTLVVDMIYDRHNVAREISFLVTSGNTTVTSGNRGGEYIMMVVLVTAHGDDMIGEMTKKCFLNDIY